jgi:predicted transcriptional regulator
MTTTNIKEAAHHLIDSLPENATWEDIIYAIYIRKGVEAGLADMNAGRLFTIEEVRQRLGRPT